METHYKNIEERRLSNFKQYSEVLAMAESSNNQRIRNSIGYQGLYQMGAMALMDAGYVKVSKNSNNEQLLNDSVWTGINGIRSLDDFLNSRDAQTDALRRYTGRNRKTLELFKVINKHTPVNEVYGHLAGAHLIGGTKYSNNPHGLDANKKSGIDWYNKMATLKWESEDEIEQKVPKPAPEPTIPEGWTPVEPEIESKPSADAPLSPEEQSTLDKLELWDKNRRGQR